MSEPRTSSDPAGAVPGAVPGPVPATGDPGVEAFGYQQELQRSLSFTDLLVYGLIFMVPIAPFGIFGSVFQALRRHGRAGLRHRHGRDGVHRRCRTRRCRGRSRWPARSTPTPAAASPRRSASSPAG